MSDEKQRVLLNSLALRKLKIMQFLLVLIFQKSLDNALSDNVHGNNREGKREYKSPMFYIQAVAMEDISAKVGEQNLHNGHQRHNLEEIPVAGEIIEKIDFLGAGVEGIEHRDKDEEREIGGQMNAAVRIVKAPLVHPVLAGITVSSLCQALFLIFSNFFSCPLRSVAFLRRLSSLYRAALSAFPAPSLRDSVVILTPLTLVVNPFF